MRVHPSLSQPASSRLVASSLGVAVLLTSLTAGAWCRSRSGPGQPDPNVCPTAGSPLAWSQRCAGYALDPRVLPGDLDLDTVYAVMTGSMLAWQSASCAGASPSFALQPLDESTEPVGYVQGGRNVNTLVFRGRWGDDAHHRPGAAAITIVTYDSSTGELLDADTEMNLRGPSNPQGYAFSVDGAAGTGDLQTIVTHEFGHAQGLAHSTRADAVMWSAAGQTFPTRALTADDASGLCAIYPPAAEVACDPTAASAPRPAATPPEGCRATPTRGAARRGSPGLLVLLALHALRRPRRRS